jgi:3-hydroxyisobutyrate dehydrogenase
MGGGMGAALRHARIGVVAFDVSEHARSRAEADGAALAESPRELGSRCGVVLASLPDPRKAETAILDEVDGLLAGMAAGGTLIDTTTTSLVMVERVASACRDRDIGHLDAPVSGRPPNMSMLIGGPTELVERHRPVIDAISTDQFLLGPVGAGTMTKLMNQYVSFATYLLIAEAATLGEKAGVSNAALVEALSHSSAASGMLDLFRRAMVDHDLPFTPGSVALIAKDMGLVADCVGSMEVSASPALAWVNSVWGRGAADGEIADQPFPEIIRVVARDLDGPPP